MNQHLFLAVCIAAALAGAVVAIVRSAALRGTTLMHALGWIVLSLAAIVLGEVLISAFTSSDGPPTWTSAVRLISGTSTFCPVMAVLGARRPHHHAWQFIVITMWIMLSLPAWEALFLGRWEVMDVGTVRGWFLWLMLVINLIAYLPTRFFVAAILTFLGQTILLGPFLPGLRRLEVFGFEQAGAATLFAVAIVIAAYCCPLRTPSGFDRQWLAFRDMFGTLWALRVIERINAASQMYSWPFSLTWSGFYFHQSTDDWPSLPQEAQDELTQTLDNLLRRFV